jgi:hypothetical protein
MYKRIALAAVVVVVAAVLIGGYFVDYGVAWAQLTGPRVVVLEGEPQIGVAYRVSVYTHCGLRQVEFDGSEWGFSGPLSDGSGNPPPGFGNPSDEGSITLTSPDTAIYRTQFGERRELRRGTGLPYLEGCI